VLASFPDVEAAILLGSRAKATHKPGSAIDHALTGRQLDWRVAGRIHETLDDLRLPHRFSLIVLDAATDPEMAAHSSRGGRLVSRSTVAAH
jgi:predicted nucleotidyltransferase